MRGFGFENGVGHAVTRLPALRGTLNESAKLMTTTRPLMVGDLRFDRTWNLGWMRTQTSSVVRALRSLISGGDKCFSGFYMGSDYATKAVQPHIKIKNVVSAVVFTVSY